VVGTLEDDTTADLAGEVAAGLRAGDGRRPVSDVGDRAAGGDGPRCGLRLSGEDAGEPTGG
jgi:hypothetical protein